MTLKDYERIEKELLGIIHKNLKKGNQKKYCSAKELLGITCSKKIIKAHTLSKGSSLKPIMNKNNKVMGTDQSFFSLLDKDYVGFREIGVNEASTFTGFCEEHDKLLFSRIEDENILPDLEQIFLLSYRALCREIYTKGNQKDTRLNRDVFDNPRFPIGNMEQYENFRRSIEYFEKYSSLGFEELIELQSIMNAMLNSKDFSSIKSFVIEFSSYSQIVSSGVFIPEISFGNEILVILSDLLNKPPRIAFNIVNSGCGKGFLIFSWLSNKNDKPCYKFIKSFENIKTNKKKEDALVRFIFSFFENTFFSTNWWNSLTIKQKDEITLKFQDIFKHNLASVKAKNYRAFEILKYYYL
ncbi:TPA: cytoplasmic protein [Mannheimia haemolytica]